MPSIIADRDARGLLDETLVVTMGRTPKIHAKGGRDHWTYCDGATIYQFLGIDPAMRVSDRAHRPTAVARGGRPIGGILA